MVGWLLFELNLEILFYRVSIVRILHVSRSNRIFGAAMVHHLAPEPYPLTPESTIPLPAAKKISIRNIDDTRY